VFVMILKYQNLAIYLMNCGMNFSAICIVIVIREQSVSFSGN